MKIYNQAKIFVILSRNIDGVMEDRYVKDDSLMRISQWTI